MDDFGNLYQTMEWFLYEEQYLFSASIYGGFADSGSLIDFERIEI